MLYGLDGVRARHAGTPPRHRQSQAPGHHWSAGLLVGTLLAVLGGLWLAGHHTVTLVVDGEVQTVETHASTVGDVLARAGIDVGADDRIDPEPDSPLVDGMRVEVVRAREIALLVGDAERRVVVTALTVDEVLEQLGAGTLEAPTGRRSLVRPSRMSRVSSGMVVELSAPVALSVIADGARREVITDETTVGDVLRGLDVSVGPHDRVIPAPDYPAEDGIVVTVQRVQVRQEAREEPIAFGTQERRTDALAKGQRREAQSGREGLRRIVEELTLVDGAVEDRRVLSEETVAEPRPRIVQVGDAPTPRQPVQHDPAPAGGPASVTANVQEGKASWYDNPYGGLTAAHRTLPRDTIVTVTNVVNGRSVQVRINDRGPYVDGRVIDLNRKAFAELAPVSSGVVRVRIEW